ncbi:MAG TPA: HAMP domain-containing sensor histidine kinase [Polyangiaceae bacterium]|jgi:signal transduction histidine kinase|nr:HAMP domain-containing sensor histidine kinase [Polyangiaceae bacterium]
MTVDALLLDPTSTSACSPSELADRRDRKLLSLTSLVLATIDIVACLECAFIAPGPVPRGVSVTLAGATVAALMSFFLARRGAKTWGLGVLVGAELLASPAIALLEGAHDPLSVLTLGVWFCPAILIAAAFSSYRTILAVGGAALVLLITTLALIGGLGTSTTFESAIFVVTLTALVAVAARHRDQLEALHLEALRQRNESLQALRASLESRVVERTNALLGAEKMAVIGRLTAGMAHEMSSPLAAILGSLDELKGLTEEYARSVGNDSVEPADHLAIVQEMNEALHIAHMAADRTATFVRSIKGQTRVASPGRPEAFQVAALVRDCSHLLAHAARAAQCRVVIRSEGDTQITGSPSRLGQAITNLLQNAIDATGEHGGGEILVELGRNDVSELVIRVCDQGGGIPDDVLPRIFEPLFTTKPYGRGTGLGLAIVKEAVETDLGGRISVVSSPGEGTAFVLELPTVTETRRRAYAA